MGLPRLRPLDVTKVREEGELVLLLRDTEGYTDKLMVLSPIEALIAARLDGRRSAERIADQVCRQTGLKEIDAQTVEALVKKLDANYMLESNQFRKRKRGVLDAFRRSDSRPAILAGRSYPAQASELHDTLEGFFREPGAPGERPEPGGSAPLTGLVSPHIDFQRGRIGYAWAYREVIRSGLADLYVILGVAHSTPPTPFVLTERDYDTPFGAARVDRDLAARLAKNAPFDLRADELTHRNEHSIEFQAVYLKYVQRIAGGDFKILPLLVSSCDLVGSDPGERMEKVIVRLGELLRSYPGRVCLLAGVDFAHIGPCFGDEEEVNDNFLKRTQDQDKVSLNKLQAQDAEGFLDSVMRDGNLRKVCGVGALYAFSRIHQKLFPKSKGEILHYGHSADPTGGEVTFASMAFR